MWSRQEAQELLKDWQEVSRKALTQHKIPIYPPSDKTRPWITPNGRPCGISYHFAGGGSGWDGIVWLNDPKLGNRKSSAHCMVFRNVPPEIEELWAEHVISTVFPAAAILCADISRGCWATNWANGLVFSVENENRGVSNIPVKGAVKIGHHYWFPYTNDQIETNVMIGRLWFSLTDGGLLPDWIVGHTQISIEKLDPGPLFPHMDWMRDQIWSYSAVGVPDLTRDKLPASPTVDDYLHVIGWPKPSNAKERAEYVRRFQQSTSEASMKARRLVEDGVAGPKTLAAMKLSIEEMDL